MEKNYRTKAFIVMAVIAAICLVLNAIFCVISLQLFYEEYYKVTEESFAAVKSDLYGQFEAADEYLALVQPSKKTSLKDSVDIVNGIRGSDEYTQEQYLAAMEVSDFLNSFYGYDSLAFVSADLSATVFTADGGRVTVGQNSLNSKIIQNFLAQESAPSEPPEPSEPSESDESDETLEAYSAESAPGATGGSIQASKDIFASGDDSVYYYSIKRVAENEYILLTKSMDTVFAATDQLKFTGIFTIIKGEGGVLWTAQSASSPVRMDNSLNMLTDAVRVRLNRENTAFTLSTTYGTSEKADVIFTISGAEDSRHGIRLAAYVSSGGLIAYRNQQLTICVIQAAVVLVAWIIGVFLLMFFLKNVGNNKSFRHARNNYMLEITRKGHIIWMNHNFKHEFGVQENLKKISGGGSTIDKLGEGKTVVLSLTNRDGNERHLMVHSLYYRNFLRLIGADMTDIINEYHSLKDADVNDSLTHLPLEKVFSERIAEIIAKNGKLDGALGMVKLTNMPILKIMLGENSFNQLVTSGAEFVKMILKPYGEVYYARSGNLLLFIDDYTQSQRLTTEIQDIMDRLNAPMTFLDNKVKLEARMGIVTLQSEDESGITADSLISNAQAALENAIESKTGYYIMHPSSFAAKRTNFTALGVIQKMIQNNEIETYFQPQLSLKTGRIVGFEGLCRVAGPKAREITTGELIAIAEQYGGMIGLGNFIYNRALAFSQAVQDRGIHVSVNVSPIQLIQEGFTDNFLKNYKRYGIKKGMFNVEITESIALYSFGEVSEKLIQLEANGINIHIDDFGVAYSSLMHIKRLPITTIKIDKGLIDDIAYNQNARTLVKNVIALSKDLGCEVVAEGVEKEDQVETLRELGCDIIQGWYIGKAVPYEQAIEKIKEFNKDQA